MLLLLLGYVSPWSIILSYFLSPYYMCILLLDGILFPGLPSERTPRPPWHTGKFDSPHLAPLWNHNKAANNKRARQYYQHPPPPSTPPRPQLLWRTPSTVMYLAFYGIVVAVHLLTL
jgi:hypothetical protein